MKLIEALDFALAQIVFDKFVDLDIPICAQEEMLTEDMFQALFDKSDTLIDIGWTPELDCRGSFRTMLLRKNNRALPVHMDSPKDYAELLVVLRNYFATIEAIERE